MMAVIMLGASAPAHAQLGNLVKKAQSAASKVEKGVKASSKPGDISKFQTATQQDDAAQAGSAQSAGNNSQAKHPASLQDLNPELFILQPVDAPENAPFYDAGSEMAARVYADFCNAATQTEYEGRHVGCDLFEFVDYTKAGEARKVHVTEYPFTAYYSYFMTFPEEVSGYQAYVRARLMQDCYRFDKVRSFPYYRDPQRNEWKAKYPGAENLRRVDLEDGTVYKLIETETQRQKRWDEVQGEAEDILLANTPYNVVRTVLKGTLKGIEQCDAAGRPADAYNLLREAGYMMEDLASHPLSKKDDQFEDIKSDYNYYFTKKRLEWLKAAGAATAKAVDMPKGVSVSDELRKQAESKAKAKFGDKYVKAIFVESSWHEYKSQEWPYPTSHRSMDVDVIIKEGDVYFVSHQCLTQDYSNGQYTTYNLRNRMVSPQQEKVNYK